MIVDTHCHLNDEMLISRVDEVVNDAYNSGVNYMIVNGCDTLTNNLALEYSLKYEGVFAALGYHPTEDEDVDLEYLEKNIVDDKVVAIGEIGLDYYYTRDNEEKQKEKFIKQLDLAVKYDLPVIIHNRNATDDIYHILKKYEGRLRGVIHCFSGSIETANMFIKLGFKLGIGGVITFKNNDNLRNVIKNVSIDNIVLETDSPYLTPEPYRKNINEPKYVVEVVKCLAEIYGLSYEEVCNITFHNSDDLFYLT